MRHGSWAALASERNLMLCSGAGDAPQKVAAIDGERSAVEAKAVAIDATLQARFPQYFDPVQPRALDGTRVIAVSSSV